MLFQSLPRVSHGHQTFQSRRRGFPGQTLWEEHVRQGLEQVMRLHHLPKILLRLPRQIFLGLVAFPLDLKLQTSLRPQLACDIELGNGSLRRRRSGAF
jgi:hypothetical protein